MNVLSKLTKGNERWRIIPIRDFSNTVSMVEDQSGTDAQSEISSIFFFNSQSRDSLEHEFWKSVY